MKNFRNIHIQYISCIAHLEGSDAEIVVRFPWQLDPGTVYGHRGDRGRGVGGRNRGHLLAPRLGSCQPPGQGVRDVLANIPDFFFNERKNWLQRLNTNNVKNIFLSKLFKKS